MGLVKLDFGERIDVLNQRELRDALREDAELRRAVSGVKPVERWFGLAQIGAAQTVFSTPPGMVAAGYMWAVMNVGWELSAAGVARIYKGVPSFYAAGFGRFVTQGASTTTSNAQFSKGQLMLRAEDQLTVEQVAAVNILSVYITAIEIPAERVGELLL
jgi:hypothetical protein